MNSYYLNLDVSVNQFITLHCMIISTNRMKESTSLKWVSHDFMILKTQLKVFKHFTALRVLDIEYWRSKWSAQSFSKNQRFGFFVEWANSFIRIRRNMHRTWDQIESLDIWVQKLTSRIYMSPLEWMTSNHRWVSVI